MFCAAGKCDQILVLSRIGNYRPGEDVGSAAVLACLLLSPTAAEHTTYQYEPTVVVTKYQGIRIQSYIRVITVFVDIFYSNIWCPILPPLMVIYSTPPLFVVVLLLPNPNAAPILTRTQAPHQNPTVWGSQDKHFSMISANS